MSGRMITGFAALFLCMAGLGIAGPSDVADAAERGDLAAVRTLIQQKAKIDETQVDGASALHWAVYHANLDLADLLIRSGAKVDVINRNGISPLYLASLYGHAPMID